MTSDATPAPTGAPTMPRGRGLRALVAAAVVVGFAWFAAAPAMAGLGEPVDPRDTEPQQEQQEPTTEAPGGTKPDTPTTAADGEPTTTVAEGDDAASTSAASADEDDDDGTSIAALGAVGVVGFVLGLLLAAIPLGLALSRRKAASAPTPSAPAGPVATPAPAASGPAIGPAPSRDADQIRQQRVALVEGLIALRDKLPSAALGDEAAQALAAAGIHEVRPEGVPFDPAHHRAVHQVATDDPARHNTVASVERPGYSDGVTTIRQPEVVVAVHGGSS